MSKKYQKLWKDRRDELARMNMSRRSQAPAIDRQTPDSNFDLVISLIYMRAEENKVLLDTFHKAKLNVEDPFHWWQLLHDLIMVHTDRTAGAKTKWSADEKKKLERNCVTVGLRDPVTNEIAEICKRLVNDKLYPHRSEGYLASLVSRFKLTDRIKKKIAQHRS